MLLLKGYFQYTSDYFLGQLWLGIIHHVCGEHEWDGGTCSHGPLTDVEGGKEYIDNYEFQGCKRTEENCLRP